MWPTTACPTTCPKVSGGELGYGHGGITGRHTTACPTTCLKVSGGDLGCDQRGVTKDRRYAQGESACLHLPPPHTLGAQGARACLPYTGLSCLRASRQRPSTWLGTARRGGGRRPAHRTGPSTWWVGGVRGGGLQRSGRLLLGVGGGAAQCTRLGLLPGGREGGTAGDGGG